MFNKEMTEQVLQGIVWLNEKMGIWSIIIPIIFAIAVLALLIKNYRKPSLSNSRLILSAYAVIYIFSGWTIFIGKDFMGQSFALAGAFALWFIALFLILDVIFKWTIVKLSDNIILKFVSLFLIFGGIFLYPVIEIIFGFVYPRMVLFGAECPTTISLIGIFIGSIPKVNKPLFVIISLNAIFTGTSFAVSGAAFDYFYAFAGLLGTIFMIIYFKKIFLIDGFVKSLMLSF